MNVASHNAAATNTINSDLTPKRGISSHSPSPISYHNLRTETASSKTTARSVWHYEFLELGLPVQGATATVAANFNGNQTQRAASCRDSWRTRARHYNEALRHLA